MNLHSCRKKGGLGCNLIVIPKKPLLFILHPNFEFSTKSPKNIAGLHPAQIFFVLEPLLLYYCYGMVHHFFKTSTNVIIIVFHWLLQNNLSISIVL